MGVVALVAWAVLRVVVVVRGAVVVGVFVVVGWAAEMARLEDALGTTTVLGVAFGWDGVRYVSLFAAASSADLRIARLVWAVTVAGRRLGWADDEVAGVTGVAGANFLAGVTAVAGVRETACDVLVVLLDSGFAVFFVAGGRDVSTCLDFEVDDFFTVSADLGTAFLTSLVGAEAVFEAASVADLVLDEDDGFVLVPLLTFVLEDAVDPGQFIFHT